MGDEQEKFSVILELVSKRFSKDIDEAEKKLNKIDNEKHVEIQVDAKRVPQEFKKFFNQYNALAKKMSTMNVWEKLTNDNGLRANQYGRFFNDIRSDAVDAIEQIEREAPELQIRIFTSQENIDNVEKSIEELEHKRDLAEGRMKKWKAKMEVAVEFNPAEIQAKLDEAQKGLHQAELEGMAIPDWKTDEKAANQEQIAAYKKQIDDLTEQLQNPPDISKMEKNFNKAAKQVELCTEKVKDLKIELATLQKSNASDTKRFEDIKTEYAKIVDDIQQNPLDVKLESKTLSKYNKPSLELKETWHGINKEISRANILSRMQGKVMQRMMSQVAYWINPLNVFMRSWSKWLDQNQEVKNTFEVISYNLVRVVAPLMEAVANSMLKVAQYANIFTKTWFNVDLFDRTKKDADEAKKKIHSVTASFDELHDISKDTNENKNTLADLGTLPPINESLKKSLADFANNNKWLGNALTWAMEHPIETAALALGAKLVAGLVGKGVGKLVGKGISKLFGGSAVETAASAGGTAAGSIWATGFGTAVKVVGGAALTVAGVALTGKASYELTKFWHTSTTGQKVLTGVGAAAGVAAAGLGGYILAGTLAGSAAGPIGAAIGAVGATLVGLTVSAVTARDGIMSVKDATEQYNSALELQQQCQVDYTNAVSQSANTLATLESLEQQTGLSGKALADQVANGKLKVEEMTVAQRQVYAAYLQNEEATKSLKTASENLQKANENEMRSNIELMMSNAEKTKSYDEVKAHIIEMWKQGKISTEDATTYMGRLMGQMNDKTRKSFREDMPTEIQEGLNESTRKYQSWGRSLINWASRVGQKIGNLLSGKGWKDNSTIEIEVINSRTDLTDEEKRKLIANVASYDVGTNYVPNDQLAMVHKGEAIIPAKYNRPSTGNDSSGLYQVVDKMTNEISSLRSLIQQGIPVTGQFTQRGSDLVAVVDKASSRRGTQPISNPAYAR